ncbi:hypothetical protein EH30_13710 [Erythrobacter sp. JL475]|nr:hypothetical protein EH30_13710 [Erythrobacter sp. JL475]
MRLNSPTIVPLLAVFLAVSACAEGGEDTSAHAETEAPAADDKAAQRGRDISFSETAWLTVGVDGAVQTTFFDADGRYRDLRNGALTAQGGWERRGDGMLCFEPDTGSGACWDTGPVDDKGEAIATDTAGKRIAIKRVAYIAPAASDAAEAGD